MNNLSVLLGIVVSLLGVVGTLYYGSRELLGVFNMYFLKPTQLNLQELTNSINGLKTTITQLIMQLSTIEKRIAHIELDIENTSSKVNGLDHRLERLETIHME